MTPTLISPPTGRRWRTSVAVLAACVAVAGAGTWPGVARADGAGVLLLPGLDMRDVDFTVGRWCRYLVIDEAMGHTDSSEVYLAVVGKETGKDAWWLEIETGVEGQPTGERDVARFLVDGSVRGITPADSLYQYISRLYVRRGSAPVEETDPHDLARFTIVNPGTGSDVAVTTEVTISTPAGEFTCGMRRFENDVSREIPTGNVTLLQRRIDRVTVWRSPGAPVFHLVRCEIERVRETRTVPAVRGIPETGPRESRTTSVLVAFGVDAKPLLSTP